MEEELKAIIRKSHPDYTHDAAQCSYCQIVLLPDLRAFVLAYGAQCAAAERERTVQVVRDTARVYSPANAVDEETSDYLSGAQACAQRIIAALVTPPE